MSPLLFGTNTLVSLKAPPSSEALAAGFEELIDVRVQMLKGHAEHETACLPNSEAKE